MYGMLMADELPLGINFLEILLHLFNLAILVVGVRFLLYKPIKKFMDKRKAEYKAAEEDSENKKKEAYALKAQYEELIGKAKSDAIKASAEAIEKADAQAAVIISDAKAQAEIILKKADEDVKKAQARAKEEISCEISDLAVHMASEILNREVKTADNDAIIDSVIQEWKKK